MYPAGRAVPILNAIVREMGKALRSGAERWSSRLVARKRGAAEAAGLVF